MYIVKPIWDVLAVKKDLSMTLGCLDMGLEHVRHIKTSNLAGKGGNFFLTKRRICLFLYLLFNHYLLALVEWSFLDFLLIPIRIKLVGGFIENLKMYKIFSNNIRNLKRNNDLTNKLWKLQRISKERTFHLLEINYNDGGTIILRLAET